MLRKSLPFSAAILLGIAILGLSLASPTLSTSEYDILAQDNTSLEDIVIYFSEANDEATRFDRTVRGISRYGGFLNQLGAQMFTLEWNSGIPDDADMLIIPGPVTDLNPDQIARLWLYINNGGKVLIAVDGLSYRGSDIIGFNRALPADRGFFELAFPDFGLQSQNAVLVVSRDNYEPISTESDDEDSIVAPQPQPALNNIFLPPFVFQSVATNISGNHPITDGVDGPLYFSGARPIELDLNTPGLELTPLVFTDSQFFGEANIDDYYRNNIFEFNIGTDIPTGEHPIVVALENEETGAKLVLFGDVDMMMNGGGFQSSPNYSSNFVYPSNIQLALNATTWLVDSEAPEYSFGPPAPTSTPTMIPSPTPTPTPEPGSEGGS